MKWFTSSRTTSSLGPLPFDLGALLRMPGCMLRVSVDIPAWLQGAGNAVTWSLPIPNGPILIGAQIGTQFLALDPPANAGGAVLSDAAYLTIGV